MADKEANTQSLSPQASAHTERIPRVALYGRVSTTNGQDPQMRLRELREYTDRRGWQVASEYVDRGVSGAKDSRPSLTA